MAAKKLLERYKILWVSHKFKEALKNSKLYLDCPSVEEVMKTLIKSYVFGDKSINKEHLSKIIKEHFSYLTKE